jgi:hypothetical protein
MLDLLYLALTLIFFAATVGLIIVCQRLMEDV